MSLMDDLGAELGKKRVPRVRPGDTVKVHYLIREGEKERVQIFTGTVLSLQGRGVARSITVRRIVQGEGVERIFPLHGPRVQKVSVSRRGKVRQARLFYLRDRVGKQTRVEELVGDKVKRERALDAAAEAAEKAAAKATAESETSSESPEKVEV